MGIIDSGCHKVLSCEMLNNNVLGFSVEWLKSRTKKQFKQVKSRIL